METMYGLKQPSLKLALMLEEVNQVFGHAKEAVLIAYRQALSEDFTPIEAKHLIFSRLKSVSQRTILLYLPDEAKDKKMQALARRRSLQNCGGKSLILNTEWSAFIHKCIRDSNLSSHNPQFLLEHDGQRVTAVKMVSDGT